MQTIFLNLYSIIFFNIFSQLINCVLHQVGSEADLVNDAIIVKLNGLIHHDDKIALKSITAQVIFYYFILLFFSVSIT